MPLFDFKSKPANPKTISNLVSLAKKETVAHYGNDDPNYAAGLVKRLVTLLGGKARLLEELEKAIVSEDSNTECVPILKIDKKDKAAAKKDRPHIEFLRLWRFPWLKNHGSLRSLPICRYPYNKNEPKVCCNPFHYEAAHCVNQQLPPIAIELPALVNERPVLDVPSDFAQTIAMLREFDQCDEGIPNRRIDVDEMAHFGENFVSEQNSPTTSGTVSPSGSAPPSVGFSSPRSPHSPNSFLSDDRTQDREQEMMEVDEDLEIQRRGPPQYGATEEFVHQQLASTSHDPTPAALTPNGIRMITELIEYTEPDYWMTITYYERDSRVGAPFEVSTPQMLIDGFMSPNEEGRFCLGYLNRINRDAEVVDARKQIGRGARFYYVGGEVFCECLSNCAIFIQSPLSSSQRGWHPSTVCKVPPACSLSVFNNAVFAAQLAESVKQGWEAVYALTRLCTIRVAFVKGWGCDYKRQTVMATPCWVEVHLNGPLQWIDRVLRVMGVPMQVASSFS